MAGAFLRQTVFGFKRLGKKWRRPRGLQSKVREEVKGHRAMPKVGYGGPSAWRGMHPSGSHEFYVRNLHDLERAVGKAMVIRLSSAIGDKKKDEIVKRAQELNLTVLNP